MFDVFHNARGSVNFGGSSDSRSEVFGLQTAATAESDTQDPASPKQEAVKIIPQNLLV